MSEKYLLLIIDSQKGIDDAEYWGGNRNNLDAEKNIALMLDLFRKSGFPVIHVQHCSNNSHSPLRPDQIGHAFKETNEPKEEELVVQKTETNAFVNTNLTDAILALHIDSIVITGFITNNSVEATARMSGNLGFNTIVISDATATFNKIGLHGEVYDSALVHAISLANLNEEYASIVSTQSLIEIMTRDTK